MSNTRPWATSSSGQSTTSSTSKGWGSSYSKSSGSGTWGGSSSSSGWGGSGSRDVKNADEGRGSTTDPYGPDYRNENGDRPSVWGSSDRQSASKEYERAPSLLETLEEWFWRVVEVVIGAIGLETWRFFQKRRIAPTRMRRGNRRRLHLVA